MSYWQISAGADQREYADYFLKHGIAFVSRDPDYADYMQQVRKGDRIILKSGCSSILAAGEALTDGAILKDDAQDKHWLRDFDGWHLSAYCMVAWHCLECPLPATGLCQQAIRPAYTPELQATVESIIRSSDSITPLPEPAPTKPIADGTLLAFLVAHGLRPSDAEELTHTLGRIRLLASYYYNNCNWGDVREHETRTFLIAPFLLALRWSEQQMKIELPVPGGKIDIACFAKAYQRDNQANNDDCVLLLESKGFGQGLQYAAGQGISYAAKFPHCQVVVASNGYCYKAFLRTPEGNDFEKEPAAYLNLLDPRDDYPLLPSDNPKTKRGALELLDLLLPQHWLALRQR